jgi:DNA (cytosine-5)-methyltransferase 1
MAVDVWTPRVNSSDSRMRRYLLKRDLLRESVVIYNHFVRYHNERDLELYRLLGPGEDSVHAIERHGRGDLMRYRRDVFDDKYYKLRPDRPSKTIVSHLAKDGNAYIHPHQNRSITVREAARLQSFDDRYIFCGAPTDQWVQVGNAVPPVLAEAIARALLPLLSRTS